MKIKKKLNNNNNNNNNKKTHLSGTYEKEQTNKQDPISSPLSSPLMEDRVCQESRQL